MDSSKQYKIALVLYTDGLDYDDRVRKEILTIRKLYPNVSFKIFAIDLKNREESGITSYGIPYRVPYLKTREKYGSGTHILAKAYDFFKTVKGEIKDYDALWCADVQSFMFVLLTRKMPILWDLHELPLQFMGKSYMRILFRYLENRVKVMVHANEPRLEYLKSEGLVRHPSKQFVLRNYPDFNEIDSEYDEKYHDFVTWLGDRKCVYLQGINDETRADVQSIGAVLQISELTAVVVGRVYPDRMALLEEKFGKEVLQKRVFFTGMIKQLKTPQYIRKCVTSLIFYRKTTMNNWFCEPNRLFQNINNGNPVVVGCNPPMKELVEKYEVGICADTDGSDQSKIVSALETALSKMDELKSNINNAKDNWLWGAQDESVKNIVESYLS